MQLLWNSSLLKARNFTGRPAGWTTVPLALSTMTPTHPHPLAGSCAPAPGATVGKKDPAPQTLRTCVLSADSAHSGADEAEATVAASPPLTKGTSGRFKGLVPFYSILHFSFGEKLKPTTFKSNWIHRKKQKVIVCVLRERCRQKRSEKTWRSHIRLILSPETANRNQRNKHNNQNSKSWGRGWFRFPDLPHY